MGMMGSRKRSVLVRKELESCGFSGKQVEKLHSPIGLAIGAQTPAEIALSVISEIVQCKNERAKAAETDEAILEELTEPQRLSKFASSKKGAVHPEASEPRCWSHRTTVLLEPSAEAVQKLK